MSLISIAFQTIKHQTGLYLCHLNDHKFGHNFQDLIDPICRIGHDIEITTHWAHYISERQSVVKKKKILIRIFESFITSFLFLRKKDLMLVLINLQSCVQMCIHFLRKDPLVFWKEYLITIFFFNILLLTAFSVA